MTRSLAQAESMAKTIVWKWAAVAAPVGVIPGSPLLLPAVDAKLIHDIAKCFQVDNYMVDTVLGVVATSIAGRTAADVALTTIPVVGWLVKGAVAGSVTYAAGMIVVEYFKKQSPLA